MTHPQISGEYHPACLLLPPLSEEECRELQRDIIRHGQRHPIIIDENGVLLDGRHRYDVVVRIGMEPKVEVFRGSEEEKIALIMSENLTRRHLSVQQRTAVAAELAEKLAKAKARQLAATAASPDATGKAAEQAAKMIGVSTPTLERALRRKRTDPEAHRQAKAGALGKAKPKPTPRRSPSQPAPATEVVEGVDYELVARGGFERRRAIAPTTTGWMQTAPIDELAEWLRDALGADRLAALLKCSETRQKRPRRP